MNDTYCVSCKNPAEPGRSRCAPCALGNLASVRKRRAALQQYGLCVQCGSRPRYTRMECYECRERRNARARDTYAKAAS